MKGIPKKMEINESIAIVEAVLFASGEPVEIQRISEILNITPERTSGLVELLRRRYSQYESGIQIINVGSSIQMTSCPKYAGYIRKALNLKKNTPLSQAALEVLSVIAYNQPVSKGFIENIRGTDSSSTVNSLTEKGLIEEAGRLNVPGKPVVYRTTDSFLRCFGLESLDDLPPLPKRNNTDKESKT